MLKKIVWLLVSCIMVLSLLIASCETAEEKKVEEEEGPGTVVITETETGGAVEEEEEAEVLDPNIPRYGGSITLATVGDIRFFDPMDWVGGNPSLDLTN